MHTHRASDRLCSRVYQKLAHLLEEPSDRGIAQEEAYLLQLHLTKFHLQRNWSQLAFQGITLDGVASTELLTIEKPLSTHPLLRNLSLQLHQCWIQWECQ